MGHVVEWGTRLLLVSWGRGHLHVRKVDSLIHRMAIFKHQGY